MSWDWEKLQQKRRKPPEGGGGGGAGPDFRDFGDGLKRLRLKFPGWKIIPPIIFGLWLLSGIYIVDPDEIGVIRRFGAFHRQTGPGPHYHWPFPIESALTPKVTQIQRIEIGFRAITRGGEFQQGQLRPVPEESLMLTGDENIVDVQFIVQYLIKDPVEYLFNVSGQAKTVKDAAEAAMREVVGHSNIDGVLTTDKLAVQNETRDMMQNILDSYGSGIRVVAVQLQDVHPPKEVVDAFKDVASAREDKSRYINEAEAYRNDLMPKARGQAAAMVNQAEAYKEREIRRSTGEAARFLAVLKEYNKAKDITRKRLYLETMEMIFSNPDLEKIVLSDKALAKAVPYLPLDRLSPRKSGKTGTN